MRFNGALKLFHKLQQGEKGVVEGGGEEGGGGFKKDDKSDAEVVLEMTAANRLLPRQ